MLAMWVKVRVKPDQRQRFLDAIEVDALGSERDEPGCLAYTMSADPARPGRISIVELWDSPEALDAHFRHPNFHATGAALRSEPRLGGTVMKYRIDAAAPVRGDDGVATSSFPS